jgi:hypothetical protein
MNPKLAVVLVAVSVAFGMLSASPRRAPTQPLLPEASVASGHVGHEWATPQQVAIAAKSRFSLDCYGRLWCLLLYRPLDWDSSTFSAARYDGNQWLEPEVVYTGGLASGLGGFDATRARDGRLWVVLSGEGRYASTLYYDGVSWSDTFHVGGGGPGTSTGYSLESDSSGKVWAVFDEDEDYRIWVDVCDDTVWSGAHPIVEFPDHRQVVSSRLTVAPNGDRWAGATATDGDTYRVFLCRADSAGNWADSLILGPGPAQGLLKGLAADGQGNIWVAWPGNSYGPDSGIYAARLDTSLQWSSVYRISYSGLFCNMEIDDDNRVWVVWDAGSNFYYRVWDGAEWSTPDSIVQPPASCIMDAIFYDPVRDRIWLSYRIDGGQQTFVTWTDASGGVAEDSARQPGLGHKLAATVVRGLPQGAAAFDAMGRRVVSPQSGIFFVREAQAQAQAIRKVVITK